MWLRLGAVAAVLCVCGTAQSTITAAAMPVPKGACQQLSAMGKQITAVPWTEQALAPERAWPYSHEGAGVTVAVLDSGVDTDNPELSQPGKVLFGYDFLRKKPGADFDCLSHGTAVSSIIAGAKLRNYGFRGVAPKATILPVRISNEDSSDPTQGVSDPNNALPPAGFAQAIRYAVEQGAKVINLSVVLYKDEPAVRSAIAFAVHSDVVVVAAAGNFAQQGNPTPYPADYPGVIGVGGTTIDGSLLQGSQSGKWVDISAPGAGVLAATRASGFAYWDGTSFATPFVSGTAALLRAEYPTMSAAQVVHRILATADVSPQGPHSPSFGVGLVDPYRAVTDQLQGAHPASPQPGVTTPAPDVVGPRRAAFVARRAAAADHGVAMVGGVGAVVVVVLVVSSLGRKRRWTPGRV